MSVAHDRALRLVGRRSRVPVQLKFNFRCATPSERARLHYAIVLVIIAVVVASRTVGDREIRDTYAHGLSSFAPSPIGGKSENWQRVAHFNSVPCSDVAIKDCGAVAE